MTMNEYQAKAHETSQPKRDRIQHAIHGLSAEVGEISADYQRYFRGDFDYATVENRLEKELGDVLWYLSELAYVHGYKLEDIALSNITKLAKRAKNNTIQGEGETR